MNHQSIGSRLFHGTTATLRQGDKLPPGAECHNDPAEALVQAWQEASEGTKTPYIYEVGISEGQELTVASDVPVDGRLARRALDIAAQGSSDR